MKYLSLRGNTYYYRRRIPVSITSTVKFIYRPLSTDKSLAIKLSIHYNNLFNRIDIGIKLNEDISKYIIELKLAIPVGVDIYNQYLDRQDLKPARLIKVTRQVNVIKELFPKDLSKLNLEVVDGIKSKIIGLPKRNIGKYKKLSIKNLVGMKIPIEDKLTINAVNDHIIVLNSLLKYMHKRELVHRDYSVKMVKKVVGNRDERNALSKDTVLRVLGSSTEQKLRSTYTLLYLSGLRPSEVYKCTISIVDGIKCFDLRDTSIELKTKSSHRIVPVHKSISNPEQMLEDYRSLSSMKILRGFKKILPDNTPYSLRHSFATHLVDNGVEPYVVSELLGHTHKDMTMGRYVKGLPIELLEHAIDTL